MGTRSPLSKALSEKPFRVLATGERLRLKVR